MAKDDLGSLSSRLFSGYFHGFPTRLQFSPESIRAGGGHLGKVEPIGSFKKSHREGKSWFRTSGFVAARRCVTAERGIS